MLTRPRVHPPEHLSLSLPPPRFDPADLWPLTSPLPVYSKRPALDRWELREATGGAGAAVTTSKPPQKKRAATEPSVVKERFWWRLCLVGGLTTGSETLWMRSLDHQILTEPVKWSHSQGSPTAPSGAAPGERRLCLQQEETSSRTGPSGGPTASTGLVVLVSRFS